ncbi:SEC-C domain-containing protein [Clostridium estertheticum]|uniref:SEC-C metal-binding domain-containing protein n=1 Tax=Clostridium estertheticum TaxID=238834 RepID=UPI0013E91ADD|nr:SEC-C metal-binding domain-containing protein [Clostridium estertheticum]MBZ9688270.1 SEC-C domain-containing protein [Clostridium estertheticum]
MGKYSQANKLCTCGSGKKYKNCCFKKSSSESELLQLIIETLRNSDMERGELEQRINLIEELISKINLCDSKLQEIYYNISQLYILVGQDQKALDIINNSIDFNKMSNEGEIFILTLKAKVLLNLGNMGEALETVTLVKNMTHLLKWSDKSSANLKSGILLENSKIVMGILMYYTEETGVAMDYSEILETYDELIENYELGKYDHIDHYLGAKSNKASILLKNKSETIQKQGLVQMEEIIDQKIKCGYWVGVANNFSSLGLYFLKVGNYKQAIAYTKRDLQLTRKYGSSREEISTLLNLSDIYVKTLQMSKAREVLKFAMHISEKTDNSAVAIFIASKMNNINDISKKLHIDGKSFGPKSDCVCGSGKTFEKCCGEADYEYESIEKILGLQNIIPYAKAIDDTSKKTLTDEKSRLNLILRKLNKGEIRLSWYEIIQNGAYEEVYELPDMASIHLLSAKSLIANSPIDDLMKETSVALSTLMLSVSALEAFLNQLIYFLTTIPVTELPKFVREKIPEELIKDHCAYQRNERFTDKINVIADIFCNGNWSPKIGTLYNDLFKLISIRNELVHFKSVEYIKIIPPQNNSGILKNLSSEVVLREISNSWPLKLLNDTFARWSIKTIEQTINYIKTSYENCINKEL